MNTHNYKNETLNLNLNMNKKPCTLSIRSHSLKPTWSHVCEHAYAHVYKSTQERKELGVLNRTQ